MPHRTALILIDAQVNMFDPKNPVADADELLVRLAALLARARATRLPVAFVRNCGGQGDPDQRDTPGWEIHPDLMPRSGEMMFDKTTLDAFASTGLGDALQARGIKRVLIAGLQSDQCIRATALGALARRLDVTLISDGHSTYPARGNPARDLIDALNTELEGRVKLEQAHEASLG